MSLTDKLFGRERLKTEIDKLRKRLREAEDEKEELKRQAEKERSRAKGAITEKQRLDEKINRQKDKIQSLEDKLRKRGYIEDTLGEKLERKKLPMKDLRSILHVLGSVESPKEDLLTVYIPSGESGGLDSQRLLQTSLTLKELQKLKGEESKTGKVLFYYEGFINIILKPPLPVKEGDWQQSKSFKTGPLENQLESKVGLIFISAGGSGMAIFDKGYERGEVVKSKIKDKHTRGGFSQGRFERQRENEVGNHLKKISERAEKFFGGGIDIFALSGSKEMVKEFEKLGVMEGKEYFEKGLNISSIESEEELRKAFEEFWKSYIVQL